MYEYFGKVVKGTNEFEEKLQLIQKLLWINHKVVLGFHISLFHNLLMVVVVKGAIEAMEWRTFWLSLVSGRSLLSSHTVSLCFSYSLLRCTYTLPLYLNTWVSNNTLHSTPRRQYFDTISLFHTQYFFFASIRYCITWLFSCMVLFQKTLTHDTVSQYLSNAPT